MPEQSPSIGRIVHYVPRPRHAAAIVPADEHLAAIVTSVDPETDERLHLCVFQVNGPPLTLHNIDHQEGDPGEIEPDTWHWPERV